MSIITFTCEAAKRDEIKSGVWSIIHQHYLHTAFPNSRVTYENEGEAVYSERLQELMKTSLCQLNDTEDGFSIEFDSTEDAGLQIAWGVYKTGMGYQDQGLTYIDPIFDKIIKQFPDVCFEAAAECDDGWSCEQSKYVYDGTQLTKTEDGDWEE